MFYLSTVYFNIFAPGQKICGAFIVKGSMHCLINQRNFIADDIRLNKKQQMKKNTILFILAAVAISCNSEGAYTKATDALDAGREFIRASLDGNYGKASFYLYKDSAGVNEMLLNKWKTDYSHWSQEDKVGHKEANIRVITTQPINDSAMNFIFSNSYKKDTTTIKIVKLNGEWLVDLKDIH
jgi:hypothetical protein